MASATRYAQSGDVNIAYQTLGNGPIDLIISLGYISHVEHNLAEPHLRAFFERIASFSRLIMFDRRGIGLSDSVPRPPTLEEQIDDVSAVMDAVGSERAAIMGHNVGGALAVLFAASQPERVSHLMLMSAFARMAWAEDYTWAKTPEERDAFIEVWLAKWGQGDIAAAIAPSLTGDPEYREWYGALERLSSGPGTMRRLMDMIGRLDLRSILPSVRVPTLIMHAEGNEFLSVEHTRYLAENIPGARYVATPGADNLPLQPEARSFVADEIQEFLLGSRSSAQSDRILRTVLFTDIVDSTRRASELGDRSWRELLDMHDSLVRREIGRFRGREVKTTGDGFMASFDGPERAVRCALAINDASSSVGIRLRAGLHTGECEVRGDDLGGMAVHIGARVAALADQEEVLVSQTVRDLVVGSELQFVDRGEHELKGVPGAWRLYAAA